MSINNSQQFLKQIKKHPERFYIIHYSCQNLNDDNEGLSPRITSIAVTHYSTEQTVSFSIHSSAEILKITKNDVSKRIDEIELELLKEFYAFARDRRDMNWVHWNMRNSTYGFEHIAHRYRALSGSEAPSIPIERRLNLNDLLSDRYGSGYVKHPKMGNLMELNDGKHRHLLTGQEEVDAFKNGEFIAMHQSTLCKVGFFNSTIKKMISGRLKTSSNGWGTRLDRIFESRTMKAIGGVSTLIGIPSAIIAIISFI